MPAWIERRTRNVQKVTAPSGVRHRNDRITLSPRHGAAGVVAPSAGSISSRTAVFQEGAFHGQQSRRCLFGSRQSGSAVHRLSQDAGAQRQGHRSRCHPQDRRHQHLRLGPAHGARPHDRAGRSRAGTRDHRRGDREGVGRRDGRHRRPRHRPVQRGVRAVPHLPRAADRRLPQRQPVARGRRVRLRGHGRLGRRSGRLRDGAVRGLQPPQVP